jgi:hypothetical protein
MIITYNDAEITFDAGGDWEPGQTATVSLNDPDMNRNPISAETLNAYDETVKVPTIVMGTGGLTLAGGGNVKLVSGSSNATTGAYVAGQQGSPGYLLNVYNTTDHSERLRILHAANDVGTSGLTETWLNVTTGHTRSNLVDLAGTVVMNYDIRGIADLLSTTDINVYVTDSGHNETNQEAGEIDVLTTGNVKAGSYDLDDDAQWIRSNDVTVAETFSSTAAGTSFIAVSFEMTHAAGTTLNTADYAVSVDFCNFDQNNGSLTHNCI